MGGLRPALDKVGVQLTILENVETFGNLSGGVKQGFETDGLTTVTLQMDTEKAFGLKGGTLNVSGLQYWGGNLTTNNLMVLQTLSDIEAPVGVRLWELWYQQKFGDKFDIKIGEQSLDEEFIISPSANSLFVNGVSGFPALPAADLPGGGPAYPLAGLGVRGRAQLSDSVTLLGGVFNGSPIPRDSPNTADKQSERRELPARRQGLWRSPNCNMRTVRARRERPNADGPLPGVYKLGAWYDSYKFDDQQTDTIGLPLASPLSNGIPAGRHGNFSLYGVADQMIWRSKDDASRSLNVFVRPMFTPYPDRNLVSASINAGLALKAPLPGRDSDTFGVEMGTAWASSGASNFDRQMQVFQPSVYYAHSRQRDLSRGDLPVSGPALVADPARRPVFHQSGLRDRQPGRTHAADQERVRRRPAHERELLTDRLVGRACSGTRASAQLTPSLRCRLVDDVVYWNVSFLSG